MSRIVQSNVPVLLRVVRKLDDGRIDPIEYAMVSGWWESLGSPFVPASVLPKLGVIAEKGGHGICAGWCYIDTAARVCFLEWLVCNPAAQPEDVRTGCTRIIDFLSEHTFEMGYTVLIATCRNPALIKLYEVMGFTQTGENITHLVRIPPTK